jgi:hypothetical protein
MSALRDRERRFFSTTARASTQLRGKLGNAVGGCRWPGKRGGVHAYRRFLSGTAATCASAETTSAGVARFSSCARRRVSSASPTNAQPFATMADAWRQDCSCASLPRDQIATRSCRAYSSPWQAERGGRGNSGFLICDRNSGPSLHAVILHVSRARKCRRAITIWALIDHADFAFVAAGVEEARNILTAISARRKIRFEFF